MSNYPAHINIVDLKINNKYQGIYIVKSHAIKTAKTGSNYLDFVFKDKTGEISGKCWNIPSHVDVNAIKDSDFICMAFMVEEFNGNKQLRVDNLRPVLPTEDFDRSELIPVAPEPAEKMFNDLYSTASAFQNKSLRELVTFILNERKNEIMFMPAAKSMHHAVLAGLLQHTTGMLKLGKTMGELYKDSINVELLLAGIILHDICKLDEFQTGPIGLVTDYTSKGKLLGHLAMGYEYVTRTAEKLGTDSEVLMCIQHMILSHHGEPEYGSSVRPMFLEADLLHQIDLIDARVFMFNEVTQNVEAGSFSDKVFGLNNIQVYVPNIKDENNTTIPNNYI